MAAWAGTPALRASWERGLLRSLGTVWCLEGLQEGRKVVASSAKAALHHGKGQGALITLLGQSPPAPGRWVASPEEPINVS